MKSQKRKSEDDEEESSTSSTKLARTAALPGTDKKSGTAGGAVAKLPQVQEPPKRKRKLDKELWNKGTEPSVEKNQLFPNADRGVSNDTIKRKGYELPVPVDPYEIEQNANYQQKLKKKEDQEKQGEKRKIAEIWDVPDREYASPR
jgi:hypothetical protein